MTIQGGGGKLTGAHSTGLTNTVDTPRRASEKRQARETTETEEPSADVRDVFETVHSRGTHPSPAPGSAAPTPPSSTPQRLEEVVGHPSKIQQMAEAIAEHITKLTGEFDALRTQAQSVVQQLASQGFSPQSVADKRQQLGDLRKEMAHLRGRIASDGRRLKLLKTEASKIGENKLKDRIGAHLTRISEMERGWGRAFLALGLAGTYSAAADGEGHGSLRIGLGAGASADRHALGSYLSQAMPGHAASQLLVSLLEEGPQTPPPRLMAEAYAELHADVLAGRFGKALQGLGMWRQAMG